MFPFLAASDFRNGLHSDVIAFGQNTQSDAFRALLSDRQNIVLGKNNVVMLDSDLAASFSSHVQMILGVRSEEQMARSHAGAVITTMKDLETGRNMSILQEPGASMCAVKSKHIISECHPESAVAIIESGSGPCPAAIAFGDFAPETFVQCAHSPSMITQA